MKGCTIQVRVGRDLYRATPAVTGDLGLHGAFGRPLHARDTEDLHEPRSQSDACMTDKLKYILS